MAAPHRHRVLGTAGHIDHGKTTLVRALTGVDCDRLPEERERGITLELGFAPLTLPDGSRVSVVDVPGHEGLVRTMVAGATGIDWLLLVVAADEGVMPQTREHVAIADLLGIDRGVVALTKCDTVDDETAELAEEEARELLAGTALADVPILRTAAGEGRGVDALRDALQALAGADEARAPTSAAPRLPIDRAFTMKGFGTVVTGTLAGGEIRAGEDVVILPGGAKARVRGVERHGESLDEMGPGARCALNLQGVDLEQVPRGATVTRPGTVDATGVLDARIRWLPDAAPLEGPTSVLFLSGTAERAARLAPIGDAPIAPGGTGLARIHLDHEPLPLLPGDRFVVRGFARTATGGHTLGGGRVLDAAPPRRRLSDPALARELQALVAAEPDAALRIRIDRAGLAGIATDALARQTGLAPAEVRERLAAAPGVARGRDEVWMAGAAIDRLADALAEAVRAYHAAEPLQPGMPLGALRGVPPDNASAGAVDLALARLTDAGRLVLEGKLARSPEHASRLGPDDEALVEKLRTGAREAGLTPPTLREWSEGLGIAGPRLRDLLGWLERAGEIVRAGELFFDAAAVDALRRRVREHLEREGELDTAAYKTLIGTTRKHAVPLMELFDGERLTVRRGERRVLRSG